MSNKYILKMNNKIVNSDKYKELIKVSNPNDVLEKLKKIYGNDTLYISENKYKKYKILNPYTDKFIHFGDLRYEDFTYHQDENRRLRYLKRATNIKGDWIHNKYSPNNLSINLLW
jgi:hypothetical protein